MSTSFIGRKGAVVASTVVLAALGLTACAESYGPAPYPAYAAGVPAPVSEGRVESFRPVPIGNPDTGAGTVAGAVVGGVAGSAVAGRRDRGLGAVAGALLGGVAGNAIEKSGSHNGFEYIIRRRDGSTFSVVQPGDYPIPVGTRVNIIYGERVRIEPIGGYPPPPPPPGY